MRKRPVSERGRAVEHLPSSQALYAARHPTLRGPSTCLIGANLFWTRVTRRSKSDGSVSSNDRLAPNWQLLQCPQSRGRRPLISGFLLRELT